MTDQLRTELPLQDSWTELRDERGKLCARLEPTRWMLEVRRNHETAYFDLRDYLDALSLLQDIAIETNLE